jgi:glutaredoxin
VTDADPSRLTLYWQPGCTSCLKVREFLREHSIGFESINVRADAGALATLEARGVRSVPVLVRGDEFVLGQDIDEVARFVGVALERTRLPDDVLAARLLALLDLAAAFTRRIPDGALGTTLPGRTRTYLDLVYHVSMIVSALLDAAAGGAVTFEHFKRKPPGEVRKAEDAALVVERMSRTFAGWWAANRTAPPARLDTYYGFHPFAIVFERTVWHVAQHVRQLESIVARLTGSAAPGIPRHLLENLPLPRDIWDEELPMPGDPA